LCLRTDFWLRLTKCADNNIARSKYGLRSSWDRIAHARPTYELFIINNLFFTKRHSSICVLANDVRSIFARHSAKNSMNAFSGRFMRAILFINYFFTYFTSENAKFEHVTWWLIRNTSVDDYSIANIHLHYLVFMIILWFADPIKVLNSQSIGCVWVYVCVQKSND
jgi:hypothetical protein